MHKKQETMGGLQSSQDLHNGVSIALTVMYFVYGGGSILFLDEVLFYSTGWSRTYYIA